MSKRANKQATKTEKTAVKQVARAVLKKYEKTFIDLARYDRGEKSPVSVSR